MSEPKMMSQVAPYPEILASLVARLSYRRHLGWDVWLEDDCQRDKPGRHSGESRGLTLIVQRHGPDTYHPERQITVNHYFPVPPATFGEDSWTRWLFDTLGKVDDHERMEDFVIAGHRPFAPVHKPGSDPYIVHQVASREDVDTDFRGRRVHPEIPVDRNAAR
jgi:hypothetical protein